MPEPEDQNEDIDPVDLDDLGDLGDPEDDEPDEEDEGTPAAKPLPTADEWAKIQRKLQRQEDRITRLTGKTPKGKPVADVDRQLQRQLGKGKPAEEDEEQDGTDWRGIAIQNAAASQLQAAGFSGTAKAAARLARLIDTDGLEPDRSGSFDLEDQIDELREEYPDLFGAGQGTGRRPAPVVRRADNRRSAPKDPTRSTSDAMLRAAGLPVPRR